MVDQGSNLNVVGIDVSKDFFNFRVIPVTPYLIRLDAAILFYLVICPVACAAAVAAGVCVGGGVPGAALAKAS